jgi:hypothetical protein
MRRLIATLSITVALLAGFVPSAQATAAVGCFFPQRYVVRCYDDKPYAVHMRILVRLSNGTQRVYTFNLPSGWTWSKRFIIYPRRVDWTWYRI